MPSQSLTQHKFFAAISHNAAFAKRAGVPQSVGRDFMAADRKGHVKKVAEALKGRR